MGHDAQVGPGGAAATSSEAHGSRARREASGIEVDNRETYTVRVLGDRIVRVEEYRAREPVLAVVR
jgi:hypothetical protein